MKNKTKKGLVDETEAKTAANKNTPFRSPGCPRGLREGEMLPVPTREHDFHEAIEVCQKPLLSILELLRNAPFSHRGAPGFPKITKKS